MSFTVIKPGLLSSFQDTGRTGYQHLGLSVGGAMDSRAHRLRIRGKRLRYLLEPFARQHRPCARAVETLKQLQDLLGDHHDMTILRARLKTLRRGEHDATITASRLCSVMASVIRRWPGSEHIYL